ncbi:MAG: hypothetical protein NVS4B3_13750 [Gemmatimonadaceae bacterium]
MSRAYGQSGSMRVVLEGETRIRLQLAGDGFEITAEGAAISPYHLLAASLASCTALLMASWARGVGVATQRLSIGVTWEMVEGQPKRVSRIEQILYWPELPEDRVRTADRVAKLCPIDATLHAGTELTSRVQRN